MGFNTNHLTRQSWARLSQIVRRRDAEVCQYCEEAAPDGEPDHILPLERGGRDSLDNLVWACKRCNREKQGRTLRQWIKELRVCKKVSIPVSQPLRSSGAEECKIWLLEVMKQGNYPMSLLCVEAKKAGFSEGTLKTAKSRINSDPSLPKIESVRKARHWEWHLIQGGLNASS